MIKSDKPVQGIILKLNQLIIESDYHVNSVKVEKSKSKNETEHRPTIIL